MRAVTLAAPPQFLLPLAIVLVAGCNRNQQKQTVSHDEAPGVETAVLSPASEVSGFALFAGNSVRFQSSAIVVGGHVGARGTAGPFLAPGFAASLGGSIKLDVKSTLFGDSVQLGSGSILGPVQTNRLVDLGSIHGAVSPLTPLPPLPGTGRVTPGTTPLTVAGIQTIGPGIFSDVSFSGKVSLQAGTYMMRTLQIQASTIVTALGPVKLLVSGKFSTGNSVQVKGQGVNAPVRIEVSGVDGTNGTLGEQPVAASIGQSTIINALILSPNGTMTFGSSVVATGAFAARDIDVASSAKIVFKDGITATCPLSCDDGNPCTVDACAGGGTCTHSPITNGAPCDDNNLCTQTDTCQAGICTGSDPVSCQAAPHCGDAGTCDPATGACLSSAPESPDGGGLNGADPRLMDLESIRLSSARLGSSCRSLLTIPFGQAVSAGVVISLAAPRIPDIAAAQLRCALQLPPGSSCDALRTCREGSVVPPTPLPICNGSDLILKNPTGQTARVDCAAFGGTCFDTDMGSMCGLGACRPGETYNCDGRNAVACMHGVRTSAPCGRGMICGERNDHLIDCIGSGAVCTGPDRCDGTRAIRCMQEANGQGHEAITDCAAMGLGCVVVEPTREAVCAPTAGACNFGTDAAYCTGADINVCVLNQWWSVSCSSVSAAGRCVPGAGLSGEAACL
jgi:hypothetical protein